MVANAKNILKICKIYCVLILFWQPNMTTFQNLSFLVSSF